MNNNDLIKHTNISSLEFIASKLGEVCSQVVFLGGCTTALFITDKGTPDVRYTLDVDCIVDVMSLIQYYQLEKKLLTLGFKQLIQDKVICRWHYNDFILDVMPTDEKILGFSNLWYKAAILEAVNYKLMNNHTIRIVTAPFFLATKLEAFKGRGGNDFFASHDFEDIISVLDGRIEIVNEVLQSDNKLKEYLSKSFKDIQNKRSFYDALPGHFIQYGDLSEERIAIFIEKIKKIVQSS